jgi:hypothetical protein
MAANTITQIPPDSTGDKLQMMSRQEGADTVLLQGVHLDNAQNPHYLAFADSTAVGAFAQNKQHINLYNAADSGKLVTIHDIRYVNLQLTAATGVGVRFNIIRITTHSGGTSVTPEKMDTNNPNLPAGITVRAASTVTEGAILWAVAMNNDEIPLTGNHQNFRGSSILPSIADPRAGKLTLREGEGITVKQITSTTVGTWGWIIQFSTQDVWT